MLSKTPQKSEEELCKEAVDVSEDEETKEEQRDRSLSVSHYHSVVCQRLILQCLPSLMKSDDVRTAPVQAERLTSLA